MSFAMRPFAPFLAMEVLMALQSSEPIAEWTVSSQLSETSPLQSQSRKLQLGPGINDGPHVFYARGQFGNRLQRMAKEDGGAKVVKVSTAYIGLMGYNELADCLKGVHFKLLLGTMDGLQSVQKILSDVASFRTEEDDFGVKLFEESLTDNVPAHRKRRRKAGRWMHEEITRGSVRIRKLQAKQSSIFNHAKLFLFDNNRGMHGSANLSWNGLKRNIENGGEIRDLENLDHLHQEFDSNFEKATDITERIAQVLLSSWIFNGQVDPKQLLIRFLKCMGLLLEHVPGNKYKLGPFQQAMYNAVLLTVKSCRQAIVVAPVGTGKTVVGAHLCAALQNRGSLARALVSAPNTPIFEQWREIMIDLNVNPQQLNHQAYTQAAKIAREVETTDERIFVIVDEIHHFRNAGGNSTRYRELKQLLSGNNTANSNASRPTAVLFTATPISSKLAEAQNLASLVCEHEDKFRTLQDFLDRPYVISVGLADIVQDFGVDLNDGSHGKALEFGPGDYRYFPRVQAQVVQYQDGAMEWLYDAIDKLPLDYRLTQTRDVFSSPGQKLLFQTTLNGSVNHHGVYDGTLVKIGLLRAAESSPAQLEAALSDLLDRARIDKPGAVSLADPSKTAAALESLLEKFQQPEQAPVREAKWKVIRRKWQKEKLTTKLQNGSIRVLIFSSFKETTQYIRSKIKALWHTTGEKIQTATGETNNLGKQHVMKAFNEGECKVLIATDTFSEGYNMQSEKLDTVVINWELFWTPLKLNQRVGRVDRPTQCERTVTVWNVYPGQEVLERLDSRHSLSQFEARTKMFEKIQQRVDLYFRQMSGLFTSSDYQRDLESAETTNLTSAQIYEAGSDFSYREEAQKTVGTTPWVRRWFQLKQEDFEKEKELPEGSSALLSAKLGSEGDIVALFKGSSGHLLLRAEYEFRRQNLGRIREIDAMTLADQVLASLDDAKRVNISENFVDGAIEAVQESVRRQYGKLTLVGAFVFVPPSGHFADGVLGQEHDEISNLQVQQDQMSRKRQSPVKIQELRQPAPHDRQSRASGWYQTQLTLQPLHPKR